MSAVKSGCVVRFTHDGDGDGDAARDAARDDDTNDDRDEMAVTP